MGHPTRSHRACVHVARSETVSTLNTSCKLAHSPVVSSCFASLLPNHIQRPSPFGLLPLIIGTASETVRLADKGATQPCSTTLFRVRRPRALHQPSDDRTTSTTMTVRERMANMQMDHDLQCHLDPMTRSTMASNQTSLVGMMTVTNLLHRYSTHRSARTGFVSSDAGPSSHTDPSFSSDESSMPSLTIGADDSLIQHPHHVSLRLPQPHTRCQSFPDSTAKTRPHQPRRSRANARGRRAYSTNTRSARNARAADPSTIGPHKMFADPSGVHLLLAMRNGDNYYWASGWKKARLLPKLKGHIIESVAWNRDSQGSSSSGGASAARKRAPNGHPALSSTREILVGTRSGDICEVVITAPVGSDPDDGDIFDKIARRTAGNGAERGDVDRVVRHMTTLSRASACDWSISGDVPSHDSSKYSNRRWVIWIVI